MLDRYSLVMEQTPQLIGVLTSRLHKLFIKMRFKYCASKYYYYEMVFGQQEMRKRTLFLFAPSLKYSKREKSKRQKKKI